MSLVKCPLCSERENMGRWFSVCAFTVDTLSVFLDSSHSPGGRSFPRRTSFPCSLNLCQQKVMAYRMQRDAFANQIRAHKSVFRSVRDGGGADPHVRQFTCGGRVKIRGRIIRTGRHFGGSVLVPFRGWQPYHPRSGRQDVNGRAPLLFVAGYLVVRMQNRRVVNLRVAQIAVLLNTQRAVAKNDALSYRRDTKTTPRINVCRQRRTVALFPCMFLVAPLELDCKAIQEGCWSAEERKQSQLDTARSLEQDICHLTRCAHDVLSRARCSTAESSPRLHQQFRGLSRNRTLRPLFRRQECWCVQSCLVKHQRNYGQS